jgi:phage portal protein BeeE
MFHIYELTILFKRNALSDYVTPNVQNLLIWLSSALETGLYMCVDLSYTFILASCKRVNRKVLCLERQGL